MARTAFSGAVEVFGSCFHISRKHVLNAIRRGTAQRLGEPLFEEMRKIRNLRLCEARTWRLALCRVTFLEKRQKFVAISIAKHDERANQIRAHLRAAGFWSMTGDALRQVRCL